MCEETATERTMRLIHEEWRAEVFAEVRAYLEAEIAKLDTWAWVPPPASESVAMARAALVDTLAWMDERTNE